VAAKNRHNVFYVITPFKTGVPSMRIKDAIAGGVIAALASMATPALAKHVETPKPAEQPVSSSCSASQQTADGTWTQVPCQEVGSPAQPPGKSAARSPDEQTH
jgi:hypothetical protein